MEVCYRYDGSFAGFLSCVFESYVHREPPIAFCIQDDGPTLFDEREVETCQPHARRVYDALGRKVSPRFQRVISNGFLTCLPQRALALYDLIRRGLAGDRAVERDLSDPTMARVQLAIRKLQTEQDHLKGFVRFSRLGELLVGEIQPKNRVFPFLGPHFANRFPGEKIVLYDRTHREALLCRDFRWQVVPAEDFHMGPAGESERAYRALWRRYFEAVTIEGRLNPKCQSTHLPKRYRHLMTEFLADEAPEGGQTNTYLPSGGHRETAEG